MERMRSGVVPSKAGRHNGAGVWDKMRDRFLLTSRYGCGHRRGLAPLGLPVWQIAPGVSSVQGDPFAGTRDSERASFAESLTDRPVVEVSPPVRKCRGNAGL